MTEVKMVSEILLVKITLKDVRGSRYRFADFLAEHGYEPRHWYANWKEVSKNVWIVIGGSDRGNLSDLNLTVKVMFRDKAPNLGATEFNVDVEKAMTELNKKIIPELKEMIEGCSLVERIE